MNITRSLLDDIKTKQLKGYGHIQRMEEGRLPKKDSIKAFCNIYVNYSQFVVLFLAVVVSYYWQILADII